MITQVNTSDKNLWKLIGLDNLIPNEIVYLWLDLVINQSVRPSNYPKDIYHAQDQVVLIK